MTEQNQPQSEDHLPHNAGENLPWDTTSAEPERGTDRQAEAAVEPEAAAEPEGSDLEDSEPEDAETEILPPEDIGSNAQEVVTALLGHQRDLVTELHSVYERLEQVREVDYAALQARVTSAEQTVAAAPTSAELQELLGILDSVSASMQEEQAKQTELEQTLKRVEEAQQAQLAERDARISAQNARIEQLESAIVAAAESADSAHEKVETVAREVQSSLIHRVGERVSPAAQQARNALNTIRSRFRR